MSDRTGQEPHHPGLVVDLHTHVLPAFLSRLADSGGSRYGMDFDRNDDGRLVFRIGGAWSPLLQGSVYDETADERVGRMDRMRVDVQVLSLSPSLHLHGLGASAGAALSRDANDAIAEMVDLHPKRFRGLAFLPLQEPRSAVAELDRVMASRAFVGAMVSTHVEGMDWDDPRLEPVLEAAESLGALLFIHPAAVRASPLLSRYHLRNLVGNPLETTIAVASLVFGGVLDRHSELAACLAHGGGYVCWGAGRFDHGSRVRPEAAVRSMPSEYLRRLYFDSLTHDERALRYLIDKAGIERVVLGTDDPADMAQEDPVTWLEGCSSILPDERRAILGGNLSRMLGDRLP